MSVINKRRLLEVYKEADLFRAKYRHADLTLHGWCFHGNKAQDWIGIAENHRLTVNKVTSKNVNIDASLYKYVSFGLDFYDNALPNMEYAIKFLAINNSLSEISVIQRINFGENILYFDMTNEANWSGTINLVGLTILKRAIGFTTWEEITETEVSPKVLLEYFKADSVNIFKEINDEQTVTANDINYLRDLADIYNKTPIDWDKPGSLDNRVQKFLTVIKSGQYDTLVSKLQTIEPYNGCKTCDTFTCSCYSMAHGYVGCQRCNTCDGYIACNSCDRTCFTEAKPCTCNTKCYQEATVCACDQTTYGYSCTCYNRRY